MGLWVTTPPPTPVWHPCRDAPYILTVGERGGPLVYAQAHIVAFRFPKSVEKHVVYEQDPCRFGARPQTHRSSSPLEPYGSCRQVALSTSLLDSIPLTLT